MTKIEFGFEIGDTRQFVVVDDIANEIVVTRCVMFNDSRNTLVKPLERVFIINIKNLV